MTVIEAIRARVLAITAVTALVGQRVYVQKLPQSATLPAVRMQLISEFEPMQLRGTSGSHTTRVQIDSVTMDSRTGAIAIDEAIHGDGAGSGLCGWEGIVSAIRIMAIRPAGVQEQYDPLDLKQFKRMRDYLVDWRMAS